MIFGEVGIEGDDTLAARNSSCVVSLHRVGLRGEVFRGHFEGNNEILHGEKIARWVAMVAM